MKFVPRSFLVLGNFLVLVVFALVAGSLVSCDRYEQPMARTTEPKNAPEYSITPDINNSPAVTPAN